MKIFDWVNVILTPINAALFSYDIYAGNAASPGVYLYACFAMAVIFASSLRCITNN